MFSFSSSISTTVDRIMMNNRFDYKKEERDGITIFWLTGSFDIGTISMFKRRY